MKNIQLGEKGGHLAALGTVFIWGTTFISTKLLLVDFTPIEILFIRFVIGFLVLCVLYPKFIKFKSLKEELLFLAAGFSGVTLYFLFENIALTFTMASNVGIIVAVNPFFTVLLTWLIYKEKPKGSFFIGFLTAMVGIALIVFNGSSLAINPLGDLLAILAGLMWSIYSIVIREIGKLGYHSIQTTRRTFFYGILLMIPALFFMGFSPNWGAFLSMGTLLNILYLGVFASAICFVTWNVAVKILGVVKTSVYIYLVPLVTVITAAIILGEPITLLGVIGIILTLAGLIISEGRLKK